jgi:hypothetical protein
MLIAAIVVLNPPGLEIIRLAFFSVEALSRNIARPIVLTGTVIAALVVAAEWQTRKFIIKRRDRVAAPLR